MTSVHQFRLPDVGEGLTEAEIVQWLVATDDVVVVNQSLVQIETAKSVVELPSPFSGRIVEIHAVEGETLLVDAPLISIEIEAGAEGGGGSENPSPGDEEGAAAEPEFQPLVGYGAKAGGGARLRVHPAGKDPEPDATESSAARVRASPPVRKLAKDLGVDLGALPPRASSEIVTRAEVVAAASVRDGDSERGVDGTPEVRRISVRGVRKRTAEAVSASAFTAPHVTEFLTIDVTEMLRLRDVVQRRPEFREVRLTALSFVARAYLFALARTPIANARWHDAEQEIVIPVGVNLGIAASTPRGLIVPNIPAAHSLDLLALATAIAELAESARAGATPPARLTGGTTTITNVGVFGVDTGTPILNPGETAILAVGAIRRQPWVVGVGEDERIEPRSVLQLALSFDHRVMDGQEGSAVLRDTGAILAEPGLALL
jgi:2-oxoisovalerate dehydrogenase E2 component (dihydrolipoyl transacylase)